LACQRGLHRWQVGTWRCFFEIGLSFTIYYEGVSKKEVRAMAKTKARKTKTKKERERASRELRELQRLINIAFAARLNAWRRMLNGRR